MIRVNTSVIRVAVVQIRLHELPIQVVICVPELRELVMRLVMRLIKRVQAKLMFLD